MYLRKSSALVFQYSRLRHSALSSAALEQTDRFYVQRVMFVLENSVGSFFNIKHNDENRAPFSFLGRGSSQQEPNQENTVDSTYVNSSNGHCGLKSCNIFLTKDHSSIHAESVYLPFSLSCLRTLHNNFW